MKRYDLYQHYYKIILECFFFQVEDAVTKVETQKIQANLRDEMKELSNAFAVQISAKDLDGAAKLMIKMKYLASIDNSLKEKLQMLMSN